MFTFAEKLKQMSNIEHKDVGVSSLKGTPSKKIYIKTSTEAVYNPEGVTQEYINNHVDGSKIVNGTITNNKIADSTISMGKLNNDVQTKIQQGTQRAWNPKGTYNENTVYGVNDLVYYTDTNSSYISLQANNQGHNPAWQSATGGWWMKVVDGSYVNVMIEELEQAIEQAIGEAQAEIQNLIHSSQATINNAISGANTAAQNANTAAANAEAKIDWVEEQVDSLTAYEVDTTLDETSIIPVQNKVVTKALTNLNAKDDLYEEKLLDLTIGARQYICIHVHYYDGHIWMACCTTNVFRLYQDGVQVKTVGSRELAGVYITDGTVYYLSRTGVLYSMTMDTYAESTLATFEMPTVVTSTNRFYASFCTFNGDIHFVLSERYNATTNTVIRLYKYDSENGVTYIKNIIGSARNMCADVMVDNGYMFIIFVYNRTNNRIYRCDSEYNIVFYEYPFFLKSGNQRCSSCIIKGNKYPLVMRESQIALWNATMPVNLPLSHFSLYFCEAVSAEIHGDYMYLATFARAGMNDSNALIRLFKLRKDYFDNFFDCKSYNEIHINNVSELKYGQTGIMSYHGRVLEYSSGSGTQLRNRYAPFGMKDLYKVKATGTSYRKYMLISQGQCQHIARVFTAQADENIYHSAAFRIPTICEYNGVFYAACSARLNSQADSSPANTVVARSFDGGVTWQDYGTATTRLAGGTDVDGNIHVCRGGNYAGRLWVFANRFDNTSLTKNENYQFIGCHSDDGGLTWSEPVNYLPAIIAAAAEAGYTISYCRTCNGSGVTLANGTLAISIGLYVSGRQAAALWYTTDGENWQLGDILPNDESNESALTLVGNEIYMTYRMNSNRGFAKLSSIGSGWTKITTATNPNGNSSNLTVGWGYCNGVFLLSCPYSANRNNLTLYKSRDLATWTRVIQFTSSNTSAANLQGYTCMVFTQDMLKVFAEMKENDQNVFDFDYLLPSIFS